VKLENFARLLFTSLHATLCNAATMGPQAGRGQEGRAAMTDSLNSSRAVRFYGAVLGLPMTSQDATMVGFETGSFRLYVEKGVEHGPVFEFLVLDVESAKRKLLEAGCTIVEEDPAVPRCYVKDPYGLVFNIDRAAV
jgi:predicted enzyme related to lactoylglutathione lyase